VGTTARFYFDIEGRDEDALRGGFGWLFGQARGARGVVAVPGLANVENLPPGVSAPEAKRLKK
jgi:hypothetical protein